MVIGGFNFTDDGMTTDIREYESGFSLTLEDGERLEFWDLWDQWDEGSFRDFIGEYPQFTLW